jgi:hypothetical protein
MKARLEQQLKWLIAKGTDRFQAGYDSSSSLQPFLEPFSHTSHTIDLPYKLFLQPPANFLPRIFTI